MTDQISFPPLHDPPPGELALRKEHLLSEIERERDPRRLWRPTAPWLRLRFALPAAAAIGAAVVAAVMLTGQTGKAPQQIVRSAQPPPTLAEPLGPVAKKIAFADAASTLGAPLILPNSSLANSSNIGAVWARTVPGHDYEIALTFPSAGLIVYYERPVPYPQPPAEMYQTEASQNPDTMSAINLNGVPALANKQNSDQLGSNFGSIQFVLNGTVINVLGHYDQATLQTVAQSIIAQNS